MSLITRKSAFRTALAVAAFSAAMSAQAFIINIIGTYDTSTGLATSTISEYSSLPQLNTTFGWGFGISTTATTNTFSGTFFNGSSSISMDGAGTTSISGGDLLLRR